MLFPVEIKTLVTIICLAALIFAMVVAGYMLGIVSVDKATLAIGSIITFLLGLLVQLKTPIKEDYPPDDIPPPTNKDWQVGKSTKYL